MCVAYTCTVSRWYVHVRVYYCCVKIVRDRSKRRAHTTYSRARRGPRMRFTISDTRARGSHGIQDGRFRTPVRYRRPKFASPPHDTFAPDTAPRPVQSTHGYKVFAKNVHDSVYHAHAYGFFSYGRKRAPETLSLTAVSRLCYAAPKVYRTRVA